VSFTLTFTTSYNRRAEKFLKKHPELKKQYLKTLQLLELNPHHPSLHLHALEGRLTGLHTVSINISYRMTIDFIIEHDEIIPVNLGTHDEAYR